MSDPRLNRLSQERRVQARAVEDLFGDGLKDLLGNLYPDQAHFLYELLQNAEDARASKVEFILESERLLFSHDGLDSFSYEDVEAITNITSTKKDDATKIGKFGVGFKAVFAYSLRPEISSGEFSFAIENLFVPVPLVESSRPRHTDFVFPLNNPDKPAETAFKEVSQGLTGMKETALLFLNNIRSIQFLIEDGRSGELTRHEHTYPHVSVRRTENDSPTESHWLRLVGGQDQSDQIPEGHYVAAAFRIDSAPQPIKKGARSRTSSVVPVERGSVCVYFPAEKQTSGLKFHVHAPFEPTPARDSIKNTPGNVALVDLIGRLVSESLPGLRDQGWLSDGLLASLPNRGDDVGEMFASVKDAVREAFWEHPITPKSGGGHRAAADLVEGPPEFRRALDATDLQTLTALHTKTYPAEPRWVAERDGRAGALLKGLGIAKFGWEEVESLLNEARWCFGDADAWDPVEGAFAQWIQTMELEHLAELYGLLGQGIEESHLDDGFFRDYRGPILRVHGDEGFSHPVPPQGYLPENPDDVAIGRVPAELAFFDQDRTTRRKSRLAAFYDALGVRRWDERALVEERLERYVAILQDDDAAPSFEQHFDDLRSFASHIEAHPNDVSLIRQHILLLGERDEELYWVSPSELFLDSPVEATGLRHLDGNRLYQLSEIYLGRVDGIEKLAKDVGVRHSLAIRLHDVWSNPQLLADWHPSGTRNTINGRKYDWDLPEIPKILVSLDPVLLRALWELMVRTPRTKAWAEFQLNGTSSTHTMASRLAQRLHKVPWVMDSLGLLRTAESMTIDELPTGWPEPSLGSLALELDFGLDARGAAREQEERQRIAREIGVPPSLLPLFAGVNANDPIFNEIEALLRRSKTLPSAASADPDRRAQVVGEDARTADEFGTEMRQRAVVVGRQELREQMRQYLRAQYVDNAGVMYCQICLKPMPFKVRNEWYFEMVQCVPKRLKQHPQNALAACPLCAALYTYTRETPDDEILERIMSADRQSQPGQVDIHVVLDGKERRMLFTGVHHLDLRTVLTVAGERRSS